MWAGRRTQTLIAAIELDLFTHISRGKHTANEISRAAQASTRGTERLLNALVGMQYLSKKGTRYHLQPVARDFLVRGKESYLGDMSTAAGLHWEGWSRLADTIKTGSPVDSVNVAERGRIFFPELVAAIFSSNLAGGRTAVAALPAKTRKSIRHILDVASGSGAWSIPFAQSIPGARVTALDFPEVTQITRQFARRFGVEDQFLYIERNLREVDFGNECYDLVILGHIIHSEGKKWGKRLVRKAYRALRHGGLLLIAEMIPHDARTGPLIPLLFALNMLLHTEDGDVFTMREYRHWLKAAGFKKVTTIAAPSPSPLILATK